jgi:hypothetical protein
MCSFLLVSVTRVSTCTSPGGYTKSALLRYFSWIATIGTTRIPSLRGSSSYHVEKPSNLHVQFIIDSTEDHTFCVLLFYMQCNPYYMHLFYFVCSLKAMYPVQDGVGFPVLAMTQSYLGTNRPAPVRGYTSALAVAVMGGSPAAVQARCFTFGLKTDDAGLMFHMVRDKIQPAEEFSFPHRFHLHGIEMFTWKGLPMWCNFSC